MAGETDMPLAVLTGHLDELANDSLALWDLPPGSRARLINVSENHTYLVTAPDGARSVLRVHRENYHSRRAIECELAWSQALGEETDLLTPGVHPGRDGQPIQQARHPALENPRYMVLFEFVEGTAPSPDEDLVGPFRELGQISAQTHLHSMRWRRPEPFERLVWDLDTIFGPQATWGDWRAAPNVTPQIRALLERTEQAVRARLQAFGRGPERFGLIHADMRLANLLIDGGATRLIDFDDCGLGWHLYDFATGISFMEDHPQVGALKEAWTEGYQSVRPLSQAEIDEIDSFVMLRRMALLAWIGSHMEAPEPQELAPHFAAVTADLADAYLTRTPARTP